MKPILRSVPARFVLLALFCASAPPDSAGQDVAVRRAAQENPQVRTSQSSDKGLEQDLDDLHWGGGFGAAARREKISLGGERFYLEYLLSTTKGNNDERIGDEISFRERWILRELSRRVAGLERYAVVDHTVRRSEQGAETHYRERRLEMEGPREAILAAEELLDSVIRLNRDIVDVQVRVFQRDAVDKDDSHQVEVFALDLEAWKERLEQYQEGPHDELVAPRLTVFGAQRAVISVLNQISYLKGFEPELVGDSFQLDPVIDVLQEGVILEVIPIISPDPESIHLSLDVHIANVKQPIQQKELRIPTLDVTLELQVPEVSTLEWNSEDLRLREGECGFQVKGLEVSDWTEEGKERRLTIDFLVSLNIIGRFQYVESARIGEVLGFDPETRQAFVRLDENDPGELPSATKFTLRRDGRQSARAIQVRRMGDVLVIELRDGEARLGDSVFLGR